MNRVEKIKAEIDRLQSSTLDENNNFKSQYDQGIFDGLSLIDNFIDSIEEEPVSNDLEEAARKAGQKYFPDEDNIWARPNYEAKKAEYAFMEGAQWQKEQIIDKACEWLKSYRQDTPDGTGYVAGIVNDKTIEEFKQAMEE